MSENAGTTAVAAAPTPTPTPTPAATAEQVREALFDVIDPELGINIVDLGLVYDVRVDGGVAILDMTLTSPACPLTDVIEGQVFCVLDGLVADHTINWVWTPMWSPEMLTEEGRDQARAIGLRI